MCLIIHRPQAGIAIDRGLLQRAATNNPHGWGIMRHGRRGIVAQRGMKLDGFWNAWKDVGAAPCSIHFRYATHGTRDVSNCHPYLVSGGRYAVMHNGVMDTVPIVNKDRSDTWHVAEYVLAPLLDAHPGLFGSDHLETILGRIIGPGNKLAILRSDGKTMLVNRKAGAEHNGLWLSNTYSLVSLPKLNLRDCPTYARTRFRPLPENDYMVRGGITRWADDSDDPADAIELEEVTTGTRPDDGSDAQDDVFYLHDLRGCSRREIAELCYDDPDMVADLIYDEVRR